MLSEMGPKVTPPKALETAMFLLCLWGAGKLSPSFAARLGALLADAPTWLPKCCMAFTPGTVDSVARVSGRDGGGFDGGGQVGKGGGSVEWA